jgi:hypothetical protein
MMIRLEVNMVPSRLRLPIYKCGVIIGLVGLTLFIRSHGSASPHDQDVFVLLHRSPSMSAIPKPQPWLITIPVRISATSKLSPPWRPVGSTAGLRR